MLMMMMRKNTTCWLNSRQLPAVHLSPPLAERDVFVMCLCLVVWWRSQAAAAVSKDDAGAAARCQRICALLTITLTSSSCYYDPTQILQLLLARLTRTCGFVRWLLCSCRRPAVRVCRCATTLLPSLGIVLLHGAYTSSIVHDDRQTMHLRCTAVSHTTATHVSTTSHRYGCCVAQS
eukprot:COSAG06_NODE_7563_length_2458_cov_2.352692_3_plen_177_part_00